MNTNGLESIQSYGGGPYLNPKDHPSERKDDLVECQACGEEVELEETHFWVYNDDGTPKLLCGACSDKVEKEIKND